VISQPALRIDSKSKGICNNVFNSACDTKKSATKASPAQTSLLSDSNPKSESSFVNPSRALPPLTVNAQGTENQDSVLGYVYPKPSSSQQIATNLPTSTQPPGYIYNQPSKPLKYPTSLIRADSTFVQPSRENAPVNLRSQSTENRKSSIAFNEFPGYNYKKPSITLPYSTPATTTISVTIDSISGQDTDNHEPARDYSYQNPSSVQRVVTQRPPFNGPTTYTPSGYNYPIPEKKLQYPKSVNVPFPSALVGAGSSTESRHSLPSLSHSGQSANAKPTQVRPYDRPYSHIVAASDNQPRFSAKIGTANEPKPPCDHTLPKRTAVQTPESPPPPSLAEFVRGPTSAASVLAASNKVPDKCNHPFLGYVCKRSSDGQGQTSN
jgi:hypothetical protein